MLTTQYKDIIIKITSGNVSMLNHHKRCISIGRKRIEFDVERAIREYRKGKSLIEIEKIIGVSRMTILRRFWERGIEVRKWRLPGEK